MGPDSAALATLSAPSGLSAADSSLQEVQRWARQRAVILAYSRRGTAEIAAESLVHDAAALVAETLQAPIFGSGRLSDDASSLVLRLTRAAGVTVEAYLPQSSPTAGSESLAGHALASRRPVACTNLALEDRCRDAFLRNQGVVSGLVVPLVVADRQYGVLGVCYSEERSFNTADVDFAETIGHMLASTLARIEAEKGWQAERQLASTLFEHVDSLIIMADLQGHVLRINQACEEITGYTSHEVRSRRVWSTFAPPEEAEQAHGRLRDGVGHGGTATFDLTLLTKHAARRPVRWSQTILVDDFGQAQSVLISGTLLPTEDRPEANSRDAEPPQRETAERGSSNEPVDFSSVFNPATHGMPESAASAASAEGSQPFQAIPESGFEGVRTSPRRAYPYRQLVAAMIPGIPPDQLQFIAVQFHDISAGGVSYRSTERPTQDTVVLALGVHPNVHYISAKIVNIGQVDDAGRPAYQVGCRFLERLHI